MRKLHLLRRHHEIICVLQIPQYAWFQMDITLLKWNPGNFDFFYSST